MSYLEERGPPSSKKSSEKITWIQKRCEKIEDRKAEEAQKRKAETLRKSLSGKARKKFEVGLILSVEGRLDCIRSDQSSNLLRFPVYEFIANSTQLKSIGDHKESSPGKFLRVEGSGPQFPFIIEISIEEDAVSSVVFLKWSHRMEDEILYFPVLVFIAFAVLLLPVFYGISLLTIIIPLVVMSFSLSILLYRHTIYINAVKLFLEEITRAVKGDLVSMEEGEIFVQKR